MNGPVPSNLVLLGELDACAPGTKVRFLGCVDDYIVKEAALRLKHNYPVSDSPKTVRVDVEHVLESIGRHEVDVGSWINVIGYIERWKSRDVHVQAIAIWDAGDIDLDAYQRAIEKRREIS